MATKTDFETVERIVKYSNDRDEIEATLKAVAREHYVQIHGKEPEYESDLYAGAFGALISHVALANEDRRLEFEKEVAARGLHTSIDAVHGIDGQPIEPAYDPDRREPDEPLLDDA